jgi:hypothetical protein
MNFFISRLINDNKKYFSAILFISPLIHNNFFIKKNKVFINAQDKTFAQTNNLTKWDGETIADEFDSGDGTQYNPYKIKNGAQLAKLADDINSGVEYTGNYFRLIDDIDLNYEDWIPIGGQSSSFFQGFFDGNNKTIYGLQNNPNYEDNIGLFGSIHNSTICNININNFNIIYQGSNSMAMEIGGLAGFSQTSDIYNCHVSGNINASKGDRIGGLVGDFTQSPQNNVYNCSANVDITVMSSSDYVGGLFGYFAGANKIHDCYSITNITSSDYIACVGGLIGRIDNTINEAYNCYSRANINGVMISSCGGLIGRCGTQLLIHDCYSEGNISITDSCYWLGGLIGYVAQGADIYKCHSHTNINASSVNYSGGLIAQIGSFDQNVSVTDCYSVCSMTVGGQWIGGLIGEIFTTNDIYNCFSLTDITTQDYTYGYLGGLIGAVNLQNNASMYNCYSTGRIDTTQLLRHTDYIGGLIGLIEDGDESEGSSIYDCYSTGKMILSDVVDYTGGLIGFVIQPHVSIYDCYCAEKIICDVVTEVTYDAIDVIDKIGALIGCLTSSFDGTISNCYYNKQICRGWKGIASSSIDYEPTGLLTKQMTGDLAKKYMSSLFGIATGGFISGKNDDVVIDGVLHSHLPQLKVFYKEKSFNGVSISEFSTRIKYLDLKYLDKRTSHIHNIFEHTDHLLKTMRMI